MPRKAAKKKTILRLLIDNPEMSLVEVATRSGADYSWVWKVARDNDLLSKRRRVTAAAVALSAPEPIRGCDTDADVWDSAHHRSHAPAPSGFGYAYPDNYLLNSFDYVPGRVSVTDHGFYYELTEPTKTQKPVWFEGVLEVFAPGQASDSTVHYKPFIGSDDAPAKVVERMLSDDGGSFLEPTLLNPDVGDGYAHGVDLVYGQPEEWSGFTVGDLRRALSGALSPMESFHYWADGNLSQRDSGLLLIERHPDGTSRMVTTNNAFMRWEQCGAFPFAPGQDAVIADTAGLSAMCDSYMSLYRGEDQRLLDSEPLIVSHGAPAGGLRVSAGQVVLRAPSPAHAEHFPPYSCVVPKLGDVMPHAEIEKSSLLESLHQYASTTGPKYPVISLEARHLAHMSDRKQDYADAYLVDVPLRIVKTGPVPARKIALPQNPQNLKSFMNILGTTPGDTVTFSMPVRRSQGVDSETVVLMSAGGEVPDIDSPGSSGVVFRRPL